MDRKRRSGSQSRGDRKSSSREASKYTGFSDEGISATASGVTTSLRKPRLRKSLSETYRKKDRFYDVEGRYRIEKRHRNDNKYEDEDVFSQNGPGCHRDVHTDDRGRRHFRQTIPQSLRLRPNLSSRSSNFRMQLYRELNVVDRNRTKKTVSHARCRESGPLGLKRVRDKPLQSKVSFSYPGETRHFERSEPIAMCAERRSEDDDWEYTRTRPERKNDESLYERSDDEVFALDIGPVS